MESVLPLQSRIGKSFNCSPICRIIKCCTFPLYFIAAALLRNISCIFKVIKHYDDVIMCAVSSQITSVSMVCSTFGSGVNQRKHQSSASLVYVLGSRRWLVNSPHKNVSNAENVSIWWRHHDNTDTDFYCFRCVHSLYADILYICILQTIENIIWMISLLLLTTQKYRWNEVWGCSMSCDIPVSCYIYTTFSHSQSCQPRNSAVTGNMHRKQHVLSS